MWIVCGLGISVYSAASDALGNASTDKRAIPTLVMALLMIASLCLGEVGGLRVFEDLLGIRGSPLAEVERVRPIIGETAGGDSRSRGCYHS
jgi:hypothetical protein